MLFHFPPPIFTLCCVEYVSIRYSISLVDRMSEEIDYKELYLRTREDNARLERDCKRQEDEVQRFVFF